MHATVDYVGFSGGSVMKKLPSSAGDMGSMSVDWENPLAWEMVTHSNILVWKIPWTEEAGGLQSLELQSQTQLSDWTYTQIIHYGGSNGKESACSAEDLGLIPGWGKIPLEKGMATHSSVVAWRIPWREGPGGLQSMESQRVGHSCAANTFTFIHTHTHTHTHTDICVCIYHIFLSQLSVVRYLGCFCVLAIVNTAAMIIGGQASFQITIFIFSRYMLRSGISGS